MGVNGIDGAGIQLPPAPTTPPTPAAQSAGNTTLLRNAVAAVQADSQVKQTDEKQPDEKELKTAVAKIEKFVSSAASDIQFSLDDESGMTVVKVVDRSTKEVIRQIPSKEMLEIAQALERLQGLLLKQKA